MSLDGIIAQKSGVTKLAAGMLTKGPARANFVLDKLIGKGTLDALKLGAFIANTCNPTKMIGGEKLNQIPAEVDLFCNVRILPGCTPQDAIDDILELLNATVGKRNPDPMHVSFHKDEPWEDPSLICPGVDSAEALNKKIRMNITCDCGICLVPERGVTKVIKVH
jgi:acetylornithine deacetylase/succinyl-diaminopimelate desuccinylase-like protein